MDSILPAVFSTELHLCSRLLDSLMEPLRAGRKIRLWIDLDTPVPDHKMPISRNFASALMRRRSQQLLSRLRRFRNFSGFSAVWTFNSDSHELQPTHHPEFLEFQRLLPNRILINVGTSSQIVLTSSSTAPATDPTRVGSKCGGCQETANCFPGLSISKLSLKKPWIRHLVQEKVPETLVSEIVRPSFSMSVTLLAPCGYHSAS